MKRETDFLVIGTGIAGLSYALKVADHGSVLLLAKSFADEGSTNYAQGGIAAVMDALDSYEKHIKDTLIAGDGLCDEEVVRFTIEESTERIKDLIDYGAQFDRKRSGEFDLAREGGHSEHRVLHHKDQTGHEIERILLEKVRQHPSIILLENHFAIDIITQHHLGIEVNHRTPDIRCYGAYVLNLKENRIDTFLAKTTLLATGGNGNVYATTTNPVVATGDGVAMVHRAKGAVKNMEFIQFHPTSLYNPSEKPSFLISEAVRGAGARLCNLKGEYFMAKYDKRLELAPRDVVARAIDSEMKITGDDHVYLDCRSISKQTLLQHFPTIYAKCLSTGIDISKELLPVVPAAHYSCGGIVVDKNACTSIERLYASGECSCTGLHGANRLASNSLLEALVFSHRAYLHAIEAVRGTEIRGDIPEWDDEGMVLNEEMILITQSLKEVQTIMSSYVGIVRSDLRLKRAFDRLAIIYRETEELYNRSVHSMELAELRNLIKIGYLVITMSMERKENRGLHYSIDNK
ncbi:MAG: L-aspartate oxidase [Bacteroidales bacterium]|jgi:L-aspartate oxidase|nr:L-aspartate oxidase [Bacteroidales bacterium]